MTHHQDAFLPQNHGLKYPHPFDVFIVSEGGGKRIPLRGRGLSRHGFAAQPMGDARGAALPSQAIAAIRIHSSVPKVILTRCLRNERSSLTGGCVYYDLAYSTGFSQAMMLQALSISGRGILHNLVAMGLLKKMSRKEQIEILSDAVVLPIDVGEHDLTPILPTTGLFYLGNGKLTAGSGPALNHAMNAGDVMGWADLDRSRPPSVRVKVNQPSSLWLLPTLESTPQPNPEHQRSQETQAPSNTPSARDPLKLFQEGLRRTLEAMGPERLHYFPAAAISDGIQQEIEEHAEDQNFSTTGILKLWGHDRTYLLPPPPGLAGRGTELTDSEWKAIPKWLDGVLPVSSSLEMNPPSNMQISYQTGLSGNIKTPLRFAMDPDELRYSMLAMAVWAQELGRLLKYPQPGHLAHLGLLEEVGLLLRLEDQPTLMGEIRRFSKTCGIDPLVPEAVIFEADHARLAHDLIIGWGFDRTIADAVIEFHDRDPNRDISKETGLLTVAHTLAARTLNLEAMAYHPPQAVVAVMKRIGISKDVLAALVQKTPRVLKILNNLIDRPPSLKAA
ncbi:MAG: HDOD domain-containing protein [Candidatus Eisenbacteria bacterium]|uniref:HDOD domain-containing protein n=1 Tax=Eiseniibacteriota bacterium TaxID=2212470 RepID=A0A948S0U1_UNCEI|nr:HDOD domain-containing protein [Candidatus Eisenbacteria bacterium]MBU1949936.1 HDOD domain-containing protein [Candidatus Eisenbacteria bacterium]MBU2692772.1 HDOD domain-containing protein [Candidatus Eisenbacteria bacterium]